MRRDPHALHNRELWNQQSDEYQATHGGQLAASGGLAWGVWQLAEDELRGAPRGARQGCARAGVRRRASGRSRWPAAAHGSGLDFSDRQLEHARRLMAEAGVEFPLVHASAEATPLPDAGFDLVFADHGAFVLRPLPDRSGGRPALTPRRRLVFSMITPIVEMSWPADAEDPGRHWCADYLVCAAREERGEPIDFQLGYGDWIRLFAANGLVVES